jgi:hypothetical protein
MNNYLAQFLHYLKQTIKLMLLGWQTQVNMGLVHQFIANQEGKKLLSKLDLEWDL